MVPGMVSHFWFTPTRAGKYEVLCAEFCGVGHFNMRGTVIVEPPEQFDQWLATQQTFAQSLVATSPAGKDDQVEQGRKLAESQGCHACHSQDGSKSIGPGWKDLYGSMAELADGSSVKVDDAYIRESILDPRAKLVRGYPPVMVAYTFTDVEVGALTAYIRSLSAAGQETKSAAGPEQGQQLAASLGCLACHSLDGSKGIGPTWKGLYGSTVTLADGSQVKADDDYLRESVLNPGARMVKGYPPVMPTFTPSDQDMATLIAFIRSMAE
ncbi:Alternative cytochrome c oxidase subunit 2 [compost metagenome]